MQTVNSVVRTIVIATGIALASSCAVTHSVNPASIVQINQKLVIPSQKARVYIQNGAPIAKGDVDPWNIFCSVLMQDLHSAGEPKLTVSPGQFQIIKVREYSEYLNSGRNIVAASEWHYVPPVVIFRIEMNLKSTEQPGVRALICDKRVESYNGSYATLAEIRSALGNTIKINTP